MRSGHAVGPILRTAAQNDQIRAALLKITSQPSATPNGGIARVIPRSSMTQRYNIDDRPEGPRTEVELSRYCFRMFEH
jgi:hypothetical protein